MSRPSAGAVALSSRARRMDAVAPMTEAASVSPEEMDLMAIRLLARSRSRRELTPTRPHEDITQAERTAMTAVAETLRQLAADPRDESRLAVELAKVARCIDVAGVLGTWRLDTMARELGEATTLNTRPRRPGLPRRGARLINGLTAHAKLNPDTDDKAGPRNVPRLWRARAASRTRRPARVDQPPGRSVSSMLAGIMGARRAWTVSMISSGSMPCR